MKEKIIQLYAKGKSYRDIQKELGCSKGTISYHLGIGQKDKTQQRQRDKRNTIRKIIQEVKSSTPCADCRERYPYWIMEFDHLSNKKFNISAHSSHSASIDNIKAEIAKCQIVCSNCHKNRTFTRLIKSGGDVAWDTCKEFGG